MDERAIERLIRRHYRERLEVERTRFDAGDRMALFAALRICAQRDLKMPQWASRAFIRGYDKVLNCRTGSWDEAFGEPYPGKHLARLRQRRLNRSAVWLRIKKLLAQPDAPPVDRSLFEKVGKELGIGPRVCSELYYAGKRLHDRVVQQREDYDMKRGRAVARTTARK